MTIQILDIFADNKFDADKEKATGTDGVIIKAGQGQWADYFVRGCNYIDECRRVGLPYGMYWVVDARYSPESQKAAIKTAFPTLDYSTFGQLGLWLDCEKPTIFLKDFEYAKLPYAYYKPVESIAQMVLQTYGKQPGIYTSPGAWKLIFGACPKSTQDWFAQSPLWTAQYGVSKPDLYGSWKNYLMWQYQESPDYSVFNGSDDDFSKFIGGSPVVQNPTQDNTESDSVSKYKSGWNDAMTAVYEYTKGQVK